MIEYTEALEIIMSHTEGPRDATRVPLEECIGRVLAEDVVSDVDLPPFNKSAMDGFAIKAKDVETVPRTLPVVMDIPAGAMPQRALEAGEAASVMTGAPVPEGSDTVVQVEWTSGFGDETVTVNREVKAGMHISPKAEILKTGAPVLRKGTPIGVEEVALLAAVGTDPVPVFRKPSVAVLSTGDELVTAGARPGPGQIRNTNGPALMNFLTELGLEPTSLGTVGDDLGSLKAAVAEGLKRDCLVLSGGVSAGAYDFVQDVLPELGVTVHTSRVAVKPGKPTVFGTHEGGMVFGLPGNPVSVMVIARIFAAPALRKKMGLASWATKTILARLTDDIKKKPDRLWFVHGNVEMGEEVKVAPVNNRGSADLPAATRGNCLIVAKKGETLIESGAMVDVVVWKRCL